MTSRRPPNRALRIEPVLRDTPDLHKLAQVFLGMALARADADQQARRQPSDPDPVDDQATDAR